MTSAGKRAFLAPPRTMRGECLGAPGLHRQASDMTCRSSGGDSCARPVLVGKHSARHPRFSGGGSYEQPELGSKPLGCTSRTPPQRRR